jgi:hypothetical protein
MALSIFDGKGAPPTPSALKAALGPSARLWEALVSAVSAAHPPIEEQWNCAGPKFGWSMRLRRKERVVLYLIPQEKGFLAGVVLGEKAVKEATAGSVPGRRPLPAPVLALLEAAPRYAEGRGLRLPVASRQDVESVLRLVAAKMTT